jgi:glycosyltransferase involved in cell wall biosynthesis
MKISVVVPAFNEEKILARALHAIGEASIAFRERGWPFELVVCDNNSTDQTAELARKAGANVVFEPINQISRARNKGGFAATGDWLIFVDADSFPTPELFRRVADLIQTGKCAGGGCLLQMDAAMGLASVLVVLWNSVSRTMRWAAGSFVFCDAKIFRELNGFSETLFASEEIEFCRRLKKAARSAQRKVVIITQERLVTSARKMHLYTRREHLWFMVKAVLLPGKVLTSREQCAPWYDGRR